MFSDEELWEGLICGDQERFLALYQKYYHTLLFIGLKEIKDAQLVKDAIQQLFLYLWEKRGNIRTATNVKSYLITSFLRKLSDDWKKTSRTSNLQVVGAAYTTEEPITPEESLIQKEEHRRCVERLRIHINDLPSRQRELIFMKFYEGLSYDEIVQQTGLSHRTVYNKIHEALKKLRVDVSDDQNSQSMTRLWLSLLLLSLSEIVLS
ncbi:MAG TPA: sigma-70 family RNA polymerase sigma factor [Agriterribacter sp.]|nr:sigma-70 family RNA polymerase sigma factor [Chitinophagaceae bacterium]HRP32715.1 sigma-70 family RNA polymerase sigma factor [Agriterribacter sp.]